MRCDEVIRELAVPSEGRDDEALAQHLAQCDDCAGWAARVTGLEELWDATRPAEPSPEAWDRVWSSVSARLHHVENVPHPFKAETVRGSSQARPWRGFAVVGAIGLAQAAAIFLAMALSWSGPAGKAPEAALRTPEIVAESVVDVPEGQNVYIRSEGSEIKVIDVTAVEPANGEDPWFNFLNRAEGEAETTIVATR